MAEVDYDALASQYGGKDAGPPPKVDYDKIASQYGGKDAKVGVGEDVLKTLPGIIPRAAAGLVGLPHALANMDEAFWNYIGRKVGATSDEAKQAIKTVRMGTLEGPALEAIRNLPNPGELTRKGWDEISKLITGEPLYDPKTGVGRIVDTTGQVMVSGPGSMVQKATMGAAAGVSGEAARQFTDNPILIGVAQMLGGGAAALPFILRSVPAQNIAKAIEGISEKDLAKAQQLMDDARRMGTPLTGAEAIAQVTGKNTLQDIQRVVEGSREGAPVMQTMMNERPAANVKAFGTTVDEISPKAVAPAETPVRMQQAATGAIREARQAGNAAAKPGYEAAGKQATSLEAWNALEGDPAVQKALQAVKSDPVWGVSGEPAGSIRWLDAAKKWLDDELIGAKPGAARILEGANAKIKAAADAASPEYAAARATVAENRQNVVRPMENSPVGDISRTGGPPGGPRPSAETMMTQQSNILQPSAPRALDPKTIKTTVETLNKQDPGAAAQWTRQNLEALFNEASQANVGGANQWGAAKFSAQTAGNPAQRENLQALIEATGGKRAWAGFERFLEVAEAQGKRLPPGSNTARDIRSAENLSAGGVGAGAVATPTLQLPKIIYEWYQNFRFGKNTAEMAEILTDPKSVQMMKELARYAPNDARATALVGQIVAGRTGATSGSASPEGTEKQP